MSGLRFSANLGFLYTDLPLAARILAAAAAGFDAVEFHDQVQQSDPDDLAAALAATGLQVVALNTFMGPGMGRAAVAGGAFRDDFLAALAAARAVGASAIHVVAGIAQGHAARTAYLDNLAWALEQTDRPLLLEPICPQAVPGYHLASLDDFDAVVAELPDPRLALLADSYHLGQLYGDQALAGIAARADRSGHLQLARVHDRAEPWPGDLPDWPALASLCRQGPATVGLEYRTGMADPGRVLAALRDASTGPHRRGSPAPEGFCTPPAPPAGYLDKV